MLEILLKRSKQSLLIAPFFLLTSLIYPTFTLAQGEQYTWTSNGGIQMTGGNLVKPVTFPPPPTKVVQTFSNTIQVRNGQTPCELSLTLTLTSTDATTGRLSARKPPPTASTPGSQIIPACPQNIIDQYNGTTVNITGSPNNGAGETEDQRTVTVYISAPDGAKAPDSLKVTLNNASGAIKKTIDPTTGSAKYTVEFLMDPGQGQVCAPPVITCQNFTKIKYQHLYLYYGESAVALDVNLTVTVASFSQQSCSLGPYDVVLSQNGQTIQTVKSNSVTTSPPKGSEMTMGTEAVDTTAYLHAQFTKVIPGTYQVCAPSLKACTSYTYDKGVIRPSVDLKGHDSDSASKCLAPGETPKPSRGPLPPVAPPPCAPGQMVDGVCHAFLTAFGQINTDASSFLLKLFAMALALAGGIAVLLIIRAGYTLMTSAGNGERVKKGREQLVAAIVGLLFIIFSFVILQIIGVEILQIPGFK